MLTPGDRRLGGWSRTNADPCKDFGKEVVWEASHAQVDHYQFWKDNN